MNHSNTAGVLGPTGLPLVTRYLVAPFSNIGNPEGRLRSEERLWVHLGMVVLGLQ